MTHLHRVQLHSFLCVNSHMGQVSIRVVRCLALNCLHRSRRDLTRSSQCKWSLCLDHLWYFLNTRSILILSWKTLHSLFHCTDDEAKYALPIYRLLKWQTWKSTGHNEDPSSISGHISLQRQKRLWNYIRSDLKHDLHHCPILAKKSL